MLNLKRVTKIRDNTEVLAQYFLVSLKYKLKSEINKCVKVQKEMDAMIKKAVAQELQGLKQEMQNKMEKMQQDMNQQIQRMNSDFNRQIPKVPDPVSPGQGEQPEPPSPSPTPPNQKGEKY
ncbi:hypothetical protein [Thalassobacillus sp. C254]|uniref:hypothetical protein n=1 Tax=Thalassobacillus sp. C254 TaxID=1225341 RepID=UPI0006D1B08C|nr:hypothetical protein [Thalassobacillus sp. C254]